MITASDNSEILARLVTFSHWTLDENQGIQSL